MIHYERWPRKWIKTANLVLDPLNPRIKWSRKDLSQKEIIEYLDTNENVGTTAKSIKKIGYMPNERPIVIYENDKYVVVDGNRRVAACKLLRDPAKAPENRIKFYKKLTLRDRLILKIDYGHLDKTKVIVAPSLQEASIILAIKHLTNHVKSSDVMNQDAWIYLAIMNGVDADTLAEELSIRGFDMHQSLNRHNIYRVANTLPLEENEKAKLRKEKGYEVLATVEHFCKSVPVLSFLQMGFEINKGHICTSMDIDEFFKRFNLLFKDALKGSISIREFNTAEKIRDYIDKNYFDTGRASYDIAVCSSCVEVLEEDRPEYL